MTSDLFGQIISIIGFAAMLFDCFYYLPKKIDELEGLPRSFSEMRLRNSRRRLAAYKRGYLIYVFIPMWIVSIISLVMHYAS